MIFRETESKSIWNFYYSEEKCYLTLESIQNKNKKTDDFEWAKKVKG